jgi:putative alpha-1,2-mannosidase
MPWFFLVTALIFMLLSGCSRQDVQHNPVDHVNLFIGTLERGNPAGLTIWGYFNNETRVMNGHSSVPLIANMYAMGARNIDLPKIMDVLIWTADNKYRNGDEYIRYGYVPDRPQPHNYCVSQTIEYSIADYGVAQMCLADGDMENFERFLDRSRSVFNKFNDDTGYLQRKDRDGNWVWPFDRVRIRLDNGSEIIAGSKGDPLSGPIKTIEVNGKRLVEPFLNIEEILEKPGRLYITYSY